MKNVVFNGSESLLYRFEALCARICQTERQEGLYQLYKKIGLFAFPQHGARAGQPVSSSRVTSGGR